MALSPRPVGNFYDAAFALISDGEGFRGGIYADVKGVPTIGYGYALAIKVGGAWIPKPTLSSDLAAIGIFLTAPQSQVLQAVIGALNSGDVTLASSLSDGLGDQAGTGDVREIVEAEGRVLFDFELERALNAVERRFKAFIGTSNGGALFASLQGTQEMLAVVSMAYNDRAQANQCTTERQSR